MSAAAPLDEELILQYVLVRRDLMTEMQWPLGSVVTQGVHAAVGALWMYREDKDTKKYCSQSGGLETSASSFVRDISDQVRIAYSSPTGLTSGMQPEAWTQVLIR